MDWKNCAFRRPTRAQRTHHLKLTGVPSPTYCLRHVGLVHLKCLKCRLGKLKCDFVCLVEQQMDQLSNNWENMGLPMTCLPPSDVCLTSPEDSKLEVDKASSLRPSQSSRVIANNVEPVDSVAAEPDNSDDEAEAELEAAMSRAPSIRSSDSDSLLSSTLSPSHIMPSNHNSLNPTVFPAEVPSSHSAHNRTSTHVRVPTPSRSLYSANRNLIQEEEMDSHTDQPPDNTSFTNIPRLEQVNSSRISAQHSLANPSMHLNDPSVHGVNNTSGVSFPNQSFQSDNAEPYNSTQSRNYYQTTTFGQSTNAIRGAPSHNSRIFPLQSYGQSLNVEQPSQDTRYNSRAPAVGASFGEPFQSIDEYPTRNSYKPSLGESIFSSGIPVPEISNSTRIPSRIPIIDPSINSFDRTRGPSYSSRISRPSSSLEPPYYSNEIPPHDATYSSNISHPKSSFNKSNFSIDRPPYEASHSSNISRPQSSLEQPVFSIDRPPSRSSNVSRPQSSLQQQTLPTDATYSSRSSHQKSSLDQQNFSSDVPPRETSYSSRSTYPQASLGQPMFSADLVFHDGSSLPTQASVNKSSVSIHAPSVKTSYHSRASPQSVSIEQSGPFLDAPLPGMTYSSRLSSRFGSEGLARPDDAVPHSTSLSSPGQRSQSTLRSQHATSNVITDENIPLTLSPPDELFFPPPTSMPSNLIRPGRRSSSPKKSVVIVEGPISDSDDGDYYEDLAQSSEHPYQRSSFIKPSMSRMSSMQHSQTSRSSAMSPDSCTIILIKNLIRVFLFFSLVYIIVLLVVNSGFVLFKALQDRCSCWQHHKKIIF